MEDTLFLKKEWVIFKHWVHYRQFLGRTVSHPLLCRLPWWRPEREPEPYAIERFEGNVVLNDGITVLCDLIAATEGGTSGLFDEANAELGVGDDDTAAAATQDDLQAATNVAWIAMDTGYPQRSNQTIIWQATAGTSIANYAWKEFGLRNGDAVLFNRKVDSRGTKDSSMSWTVQLKITLA
ncbi:MAG: hypothetical protein BroJett011_62830 [Chloroflexota bacterium]|nr:MAG: hypothetical protein BroJett011_62830 [Chloroflexota bacterium]